MGDNIARELVARHAADDARHTTLKLFHLKSVRQDRRQLGWIQPLVTEGKIDRLSQRSHGILEIHLTVGVGHFLSSPLERYRRYEFPQTDFRQVAPDTASLPLHLAPWPMDHTELVAHVQIQQNECS